MTFEEIYNSILTDWCNKLGITTDEAGNNIIVISKVMASGIYLSQKMVSNFENNIWVGSMEADKLIEVGQDKIGRTPYEATKGEYTCSTVAIGSGGSIEEGAIFTLEISGVIYSYESTQTISAGDDISVRALTAGTAPQLTGGEVLTSKQNLSVADNEITVTAVTEVPGDAESIEEYREVIVEAERLRLGNGNASDYILWVTNVSGMRTAYPYTAPNEAGKAVIYCESSDSEVLIPDSGLISLAIDSIKYDSDGYSQPPVEFFDFVNDTYILPVQITKIKLEFENGLVSEQSAIEGVIRAYLLNKRPFLATVNKQIAVSSGFNTLENTVSLIDIISVLASADITFTNVTMSVDILSVGTYVEKTQYAVGYRGGSTYPSTPSPSDDPALAAYYGECPRLDSIVFL